MVFLACGWFRVSGSRVFGLWLGLRAVFRAAGF